MCEANNITSLETARALREIAEDEAQLDIFYPDGGPQSDDYYRAVAHHHKLFLAAQEQKP
jgi:hypothetical protein